MMNFDYPYMIETAIATAAGVMIGFFVMGIVLFFVVMLLDKKHHTMPGD